MSVIYLNISIASRKRIESFNFLFSYINFFFVRQYRKNQVEKSNFRDGVKLSVQSGLRDSVSAATTTNVALRPSGLFIRIASQHLIPSSKFQLTLIRWLLTALFCAYWNIKSLISCTLSFKLKTELHRWKETKDIMKEIRFPKGCMDSKLR